MLEEERVLNAQKITPWVANARNIHINPGKWVPVVAHLVKFSQLKQEHEWLSLCVTACNDFCLIRLTVNL
jgi:hypothetical protein